MLPIQSVAVIGAGAMGAVYASQFYDMDPECISLVAGGERKARLEADGLTVNGKTYRISVVSPDDRTPRFDFILVAVKHYQLDSAIEDLRNRVGENTSILSVMNGIDSEERIGAVYGMPRVVYAIAAGIDAVRDAGGVTVTTRGKILFGERENRSLSERVRRIQRIFDQAGIVHETPEDMIRMLWWKFMVNVGMNQVSAVVRGTYGIFQRSRHASEMMVSGMKEVVALAKAAGVNLSEKDIDDWFSIMSGMSAKGKTSMLQDVEAERKTEVEMFAGRVIKLGKRHGVPTPFNEFIYPMIRATEATYLPDAG